jgi:hypothetical protein
VVLTNLWSEVCPNGQPTNPDLDIGSVTAQNQTTFGKSTGRSANPDQCSDWLYVWGELASTGDAELSTRKLNILSCNESVESVETDVIYYGEKLQIMDWNPPVAKTSTALPQNMTLPPLRYDTPFEPLADAMLDPFFTTLVSMNQVGERTLAEGAEGSAKMVQAAIKRQHEHIRAQSLSLQFQEPGKSGPIETASALMRRQARPSISANVRSSRLILRLDWVVTRLVQALLGAVLLLQSISWAVIGAPQLPRAPTSIASVMAWLVDGNVLEYMSPDSAWQTPEQIRQLFEHDGNWARFRLVWDKEQNTCGIQYEDGQA